MPEPVAPTYDRTKIIPPWSALLLDGKAIGPSSVALTGKTNASGTNTGAIGGLFAEALDSTGSVMVAAPPGVIVTHVGRGGIGIGGTATFPVVNPVTLLVSSGSIGIGGSTAILRAIIAATGGIGVSGTADIRPPRTPLTATGGIGISGSVDIRSPITPLIAIGGVGVGGTGFFIPTPAPVIATGGVGVGGSTSVVSLMIAAGGVGVSGAADIRPLITPLIAIGGVGVGGTASIQPPVVPYEAETIALLARLGGSYDSTRQDAINTFIKALKTANLWSTIDALYILAAPNSSDAALNWKSTSYTITVVGTPTFTTDRGYGTNWSGSNYLNTNFTPSTAGGNFAQNSGTIAIYSRTNTNAVNRGDMGVNLTHGISLYPREGSLFYGAMNITSGTLFNVGNASDSLGLFAVSRTASNLTTAYRNSASLGTSAGASTGLPTGSITIGAIRSGASSVSNSSTRQLAAGVIASGWSATNVSDFYTALQQYLTAIGANV